MPQALLESMRAEQRRQADLIERQAAMLRSFADVALHADHNSLHPSLNEREPTELTAVHSVLLPMEPLARPHQQRNLSGKAALVNSSPQAGAQHTFRSSGCSSPQRHGTLGRSQTRRVAAFGSSVATGRVRR